MSCLQQLPALPIPANGSTIADAEYFCSPDDAWIYYLANDTSSGLPFNESATLELVRHGIESCRDWNNICQDPSQIFASPTNLGVCVLYPNLTAVTNESLGHGAPHQEVGLDIPTCLISYCALAPADTICSTNCSVGNLLTADGHLSGQGIGNCWMDLYMRLNPNVNPDIAGIGVSTAGLPDV